MPDHPGGPTEAAVAAAFDAHASYSSRVGIERALDAAHDPVTLGDARSVNESWCRADQTRQIVEALRTDEVTRQVAAGEVWTRPDDTGVFALARAAADSIADHLMREFGGEDA